MLRPATPTKGCPMSSRSSIPRNRTVHHPRALTSNANGRVISKPTAAYRQRDNRQGLETPFNAPELWHEPRGAGGLRVNVQPAGDGYFHPVTEAEVRDRLAQLPQQFVRELEVVQFSRMTRKRQAFPC